MATENIVKVVFEAYVDKYKRQVEELINQTKNFGNVGQQMGENIENAMDEAGTETQNLSESMQEAVKETQDLGNKGEKAGNKLNDGMKTAGEGTQKLISYLQTAVKLIAIGFVVDKLKDFSFAITKEYGKTQTALGELASLGVQDLEAVREAAIDFSNTWSGVVREDFVTAAYDIKSGISSLSDEGVAKMTEMAALTAKATKATVGEMTSLFAQGYNIYRNQFGSDFDFGENFATGISQAVKAYKTSGQEMSSYLSSLGATAEKAGVSLAEVLAIGGELQGSMSGSEAATKYQSFLDSVVKAGQKLNLEFIDSTTNQLKSTIDIIELLKIKYGEELQPIEVQQLSEIFGTDEAMDMLKNLYNKTDSLKSNIAAINKEMSNGTDLVEEMASAMNKGLLEKVELLKQKIKNMFEKLGKAVEPYISDAFDEIFISLDKLQEDKTLDNMAQSIGNIAKELLALFKKLVDNVPETLESIANAVSWLSENFNILIDAVYIGVGAFGALKVAMMLFSITANPIVAIIGAIISAITYLYATSETFRKGVQGGCYALLTSVLYLARGCILFFQKTAEWLKYLFILMPNLSKKFGEVSDGLKNLLDDVDDKIGETQNKLKELANGANEAAEAIENIELEEDTNGDDGGDGEGNKESEEPKIPETPYVMDLNTDDRTAFEKAKDEIDDTYESREDLVDSQIDYADATGDNKLKKIYQNNLVTILYDKLAEYMGLEKLTANEKEKNMLEIAKNRILTQIANTVEGIKDGVERLTGSFNAPSELETLTNYAYSVNNSSKVNRTYNLYLSVKDLSKESAAELKKRVDVFANGFMGKDELVVSGMSDVSRNYS